MMFFEELAEMDIFNAGDPDSDPFAAASYLGYVSEIEDGDDDEDEDD